MTPARLEVVERDPRLCRIVGRSVRPMQNRGQVGAEAEGGVGWIGPLGDSVLPCLPARTRLGRCPSGPGGDAMVTPRMCRLCEEPSLFLRPPLCAQHLDGFEVSGERRRADGIQREFEAGRITHRERDWRCNIALTDYITRVLAELEVERGRT